MKPIIIAALLAGAAGGTVEGVREVPLADDLPGFAGVFEESYQPRTADEVRVRLDDGRVVTLVPGAMQLFQPGERVLVIPEREGARIEHLLLEP
jgi:hypothetical protein